jgi:hypothetical protein
LYAALQTAPEAELPERLAEFLLLGQAGQDALVRALDSDRAELAQAAERTLAEEIDRWKGLPISEASPRVAQLAQALAQRAGKFGPHGDAAARRFALELLDWPLDRSSASSTQVATNCEAVLRAPSVEPLVAQRASSRQAGIVAPPLPRRELNQALRGDRQQAAWLELPGGGLPIDVTRTPLQPTEPLTDDAVSPRPIVLPDERTLISAPPARLEPPYAYPLPRPTRGVPAEIDEPPLPPNWPLRPPEAPESAEDSNRRLSVETALSASSEDRMLGLMHLLHDRDAQVQQTAEDELRRHGFDDRTLELAKRLAHPDAQQRIALASLLPRLADVDARAWLLHLSRDPDERVRRAALSVMSATRDPELLDQVRRSGP